MTKKLFFTFLVCASIFLYAQQAVNQVGGPPAAPLMQEVYVYTGGNVTAICWSPAMVNTGNRSRTQVTITAISKANPAVVTSTAHGLNLNTRPGVTISGATGTGWVSGATGVNRTTTATVIDANTFSIPVDTTTNGTLGGAIVFITTAPRLSVAEWAVQKIAYDGSGNVLNRTWIAGSAGMAAKCSDASSTTVEHQ
jgi:hypothetical protein